MDAGFPSINALGWERPLQKSLSNGRGSGWIPSLEETVAWSADHGPSSPYWNSHPLYDLVVTIIRATNLPWMDWYNGQADPYILLNFHLPTGQQLKYRTETIYNTKNPTFNETFELQGAPAGTSLEAQVWDKDVLTPDELIGQASYTFMPQESFHGGYSQQTSGEVPVILALSHPRRKGQGHLEIQIRFQPSEVLYRKAASMRGPVRYRQHMSPLAGALMGHWSDDNTLNFSCYKLFLNRIEEFFPPHCRCPWNRAYDKAVTIFSNPLVVAGITAQHSSLYSTAVLVTSSTRSGVLQGPQDLFALLNYGRRAMQLRYFTYVLCEDSMRFSETGAAFLSDMMSKHAMHAGAATEVLMSGEFALFPDAAAPGGMRMVIDNNSGTYGPPPAFLPNMAELLAANFSGLVVEGVDQKNPRLEEYHKMVPSRC